MDYGCGYSYLPHGLQKCSNNCCSSSLKDERCKLEVKGRGSIKTLPDAASINIGAVTTGTEIDAVQRENSRVMANIINALKAEGVQDRDIKTVNYDIDMLYDYVEGSQVFRGYRLSNILKVNIRDMEAIGKIIDTAVRNGANSIGNIVFTLSDFEDTYNRALSMALRDAYEKANILGSDMGVRIGRAPSQVFEESQGYRPQYDRVLMKSVSEAATPVEIGEIEVTADLRCIFEYSCSF